MKDLRSISYMVVATIISVSLIICVSILMNSLLRVKSSSELIHVTGSAHKTIRSDYIIWHSAITERASTVAQAYARIKSDSDKVQAYLISKGVASKEIFPMPIETQVLHPRPASNSATQNDPTIVQPIAGYELTEGIEVRSNAVDAVDHVAREATEMLSAGIPIASHPPQYIYSQMDSLKLTMLAEATKDAHDRADRIAASSGCHLGDLRFARTGVTQIEALSAEEGVTDSGANDTSSIDKKVTAIVKADYSIR